MNCLMKNRCIHLASAVKTKKEKEDLRKRAKAHLDSCQGAGLSSYELAFLVAYLQYKSNDFAKALTTIMNIPDVIIRFIFELETDKHLSPFALQY